MATATAYLGVNMEEAQVGGGEVTEANSSYIQVSYGYAVQHYYGSFSYRSDSLSGGTVTSTSYYEYGQKVYDITGESLSATTVESYLDTADAQGLFNYAFSGDDTITGSYQNDVLKGYAGNDDLEGGSGNDILDGGTGIDTANYAGRHDNYTIQLTSIVDNSTSDGTDTLTNIERLSFADKTIALDINDNAGEAYRIYKAAFDRVPDLGGLGFWINALDNGATLLEMASGFTNSAEFSNLYGANNSNDAYLNLLYNNVLDRDGDAGGHAFWLGHLDAETVTREQLLIDFSESTENQANVIDLIANGIEYTSYI